MPPEPPPDTVQPLVQGYNRMMERVHETLDQVHQPASTPLIREAIAAAKDQALERGELTREQAEHVAEFLLRDLEAAGGYLADTGLTLRDWLHIDLHAIEDRILEAFELAADRTKVELLALEDRARRATQYHTGEVTGIGTLQCAGCGKLLHIHGTRHIPPCPHCRGTQFVRHERGRH